MNNAIHIFIPGPPVAKGSPKMMINRRTGARFPGKDSKKLEEWEKVARGSAIAAMQGRELLRGAVRLEVEFVFPRPKSHIGKNRRLLSGKPFIHISKPDLDKLMRALGDCMNGIVYADDSMICRCLLMKRYENVDVGISVGTSVSVFDYGAELLHPSEFIPFR